MDKSGQQHATQTGILPIYRLHKNELQIVPMMTFFIRSCTVKRARRVAAFRCVAVALVGVAAVICGSVYAAAVCLSNVGAGTAPASNFSINATNGTVTDSVTGLMWKQCSEGQSGSSCTGTTTAMGWTFALKATVASNFAGYNDWRLPNAKELESIVDYRCNTPAINEAVFPATVSGIYWSSTTSNNYGPNAWAIDFELGRLVAHDKGEQRGIRLVRGGDAFDALAPLPCGLDIDGDTNYVANIDGLLILRYLLGLSGSPLVGGVTIAATAPRQTSGDFTAYMATHDFDIVGKGSAGTAAIDGIVLLRAMLGFKGTAVTTGLPILPAWQRPDWTTIGPYLRNVCLMPVTQ